MLTTTRSTRAVATLMLCWPLLAGAHQSNPGATHTLLLDFGEFTSSASWPYKTGMGSANAPYVSPALFPGNAPENFSQSEKDDFILRIWRRVAEDYAPFDINVVTLAPADFEMRMTQGTAARVAIGGTTMDLGGSSGKAPPGGYVRGNMARTAFARGRMDDGTLRSARQIATTIAHEAAHMMGESYHYVDAGPGTCRAAVSTGLEQAHLSRFQSTARDKWWSDVGAGMDFANNSTCRLRGDAGVIRAALGRRAPLAPGNASNALQPSAPRTLVGAGVILDNNATSLREQQIEACGGATGWCDHQPIPMGWVIGRGPDEWLFRARSGGNVRIRVNTINRDLVGGSTTPIDSSSANLDADFKVYVASRGSSTPAWVEVVSSANRQTGDRFSAEYYLQVTHQELRTYVVSVRTREAYGDLGQYRIEVYAGNNNISAWSPLLKLKDPFVPRLDPPVLKAPGPVTISPKSALISF